MRYNATKIQLRLVGVAIALTLAFLLAGCSSAPTGGSWAVDPARGELVIVTTPWAEEGPAAAGGAVATSSFGLNFDEKSVKVTKMKVP